MNETTNTKQSLEGSDADSGPGFVLLSSDDLDNAPPEAWLWCLHCNRFFQKRRLRIDFLGNRERCAFCDIAGLGIDIFPWDTFRREGWPASTAELRHGSVAR